MPKSADLIGCRFGKLVVVSQGERDNCGNIRSICKCDCGGIALARVGDLKRGQKYCRNCGKGSPTHKLSHLPEFAIWANMKQRCENKKSQSYFRYGARGISYCERWKKFENFYSDMGSRPSKSHTLERKNNNGNYELSNCKWATRTEQARNLRSNRLLEYNGETKCISEWGEIFGLKHDTIASRLDLGFTIEEALTTPIKTPQHWITVNGERMTVNQAEKALGFTSHTIGARLKRGYTEHEAIAIPKGISKKEYYQK